jgi:hypothetical protein
VSSYGPSGLLPSEAFSQRWRARRREQELEQTERARPRMPFGQWSVAIPEPQTGKLDFERFPYQREIYMETGELAEVVCEKGTQVGLTTKMLRWAAWVADQLNGTVMYVMPTQPDVWDLSDQRVKPLIRGSEYLQSRMAHDDPDNKGLKKIGRGYIYFRGSKEAHGLDSVPAWGLVLDEYDTLAQVNIPVAEERVGAAPNPMIRRIGVPTLDGIGIDREYQASDMRRWLVKCEACNHWQRIRMENLRWERLDPKHYRAWRVCVKCDRELDVRRGQWVPEHPDREVRGYHVPRLIVPNADMGRIARASQSEKVEELENHFHRNLAEPYEHEENRLSRAAIESCRREGIELAESYIGFNPVTMGVDQASSRGLHVRISEHLNEKEKRVLTLRMVDDDKTSDPEARSAIRKLGLLMDTFNVKMCAIDHLPDGRMARALASAYPGRVMLVALSDVLKQPMSEVPKPQAAEQLVSVNRTVFLDATLDLFRWQRNLLPRRQPLPQDYEEQLRAPVRRRVQRKDGQWTHRYESTGGDHWAMAELFDVVATEVWRLRLMSGVLSEHMRQQEVQPPEPTPDFSEWEGKPWEQEYRPGGQAADGEDWDDGEYRPFGE